MTLLDDRPVASPYADRRSRWVWLVAATVAVLVALLLVHGGPSTSSSSSTVSSGPAAAPAPGVPAAGVTGSVPQPAVVRQPLGAAAKGGSASGAGSASKDGARIVKAGSVDLTVARGTVGRTVTAVQSVVVAARGYASDSSTSESGSRPTATTTYRVPVAAFEKVLGQVRQLPGVTVAGTTTSGQDVTGTYADAQAQIQSLTAARSRFLAILAQARTIAETLSVQQRVDQVQGQIDQLESQRRVLAGSSDLSTLTVTVATKGAPDRRTSGLGAAFRRAGHGFASGLESLVSHSGGALLVLLVAALLLGLARLGQRVLARH